jgi:hypothetical protein
MTQEDLDRITSELPWHAQAGCTPGIWFYMDSRGRSVTAQEYWNHIADKCEALLAALETL